MIPMHFATTLPYLGTLLGAAWVFFPRSRMKTAGLNAFAAGIMTAASIWSLILPALESSTFTPGWLPALAGIWLGLGFLGLTRRHAAHPAGTQASPMTLAVAIHDLPEGMALGAAILGFRAGSVSESALISLALGIAIQNIPEGALLALPYADQGAAKCRSFGLGALSGLLEPAGMVLTVALGTLALPALPWILGFAAGAMLYVVASELLPESGAGNALYFGAGFTLMMLLDVALG